MSLPSNLKIQETKKLTLFVSVYLVTNIETKMNLIYKWSLETLMDFTLYDTNCTRFIVNTIIRV